MNQLRGTYGTTWRALRGAALALALGACGGSGKDPGATATTAPPLTGDTTCSGPTVHEKHIAQFSCDSCHPTGATWGFTKAYTFPSGRTTTAGGTLTVGSGTTPTSCTVACHYPMGATAHPVQWTDPGPFACTACHDVGRLPPAHVPVLATATRADCQACHGLDVHMAGTVKLVGHSPAWMAQADSGFHAFSANQGLGPCQGCHLPDLSGGPTGFACGQCHDVKDAAALVTRWKDNCLMCHGGGDSSTGAPPVATWGNAGDPNRGGGTLDAVRVGAHTAHMRTDSPIAPAFNCGVCHMVPADALSHGHIDAPTASVSFAGLASSGVYPAPTWDRTAATCSNTYCHGATLAGGTNKTPVWTIVGQGQAACGTCHGVPPVSVRHPPVGTDLKGCNPCHSGTIDPNGVIIPSSAGGEHLDGLVEATGGHSASWMDRMSPDFHAFSANRAIASCTTCHAADLSGGSTGVACASCHAAGGPGNDFGTCTACHGGGDNATGAPPVATWGNAGDPNRGGGTADAVRVGAHTKHVGTTAVTTPFDCVVCHVTPSSILSTAHIDMPTALVTFGGLATSGGALPFFNRVDATCSSTYCHGNYSGTYAYQVWDWGLDAPVPKYAAYVGRNATPVWTDGPMTCGSCHGSSGTAAGVWHTGLHANGTIADGNSCQLCHPDAAGSVATGTSITNPALHMNGAVDVTPRWTSRCLACH